MKTTNVRQHMRRTPSGKFTSVTRHKRTLGELPVARAPRRTTPFCSSVESDQKRFNELYERGFSVGEIAKKMGVGENYAQTLFFRRTKKDVEAIEKNDEEVASLRPSVQDKYELRPINDRAKSFYKKAMVYSDGDKRVLRSYGTNVAEYDLDTKQAKVHGTYSATTLRHIKEFLRQQGLPADTRKQIMKDYGAKNEWEVSSRWGYGVREGEPHIDVYTKKSNPKMKTYVRHWKDHVEVWKENTAGNRVSPMKEFPNTFSGEREAQAHAKKLMGGNVKFVTEGRR